jgi:hypothetical protein
MLTVNFSGSLYMHDKIKIFLAKFLHAEMYAFCYCATRSIEMRLLSVIQYMDSSDMVLSVDSSLREEKRHPMHVHKCICHVLT